MTPTSFYDNMLKDEGYLSFTLPVSVGQHIASKSIVSYIWIFVTAVVCVVSILVLTFSPSFDYIGAIGWVFDEITENDLWQYAIKIIISMVIGIYSFIAIAYACLAVGQLYAKHRIVGAVIAYIGLYMINQIIGSIFLIANLKQFSVIDSDIMPIDFLNSYLNYSIILTIVEAIILTIVTNIVLNKKLNLE